MKKIVGIEIAEDSVRLVCFAGRELKKAVTVETPEGLVSGGRILSMDAMADFIKEMAKEKTFCKNSVTSPKGILTQKEQGIRPALFALMCDKREKSCKSALLAVVADQIESQQNNSSYDSDDVSNTHDKILLNISYSLRVWNPVKIY